MRLVTIALSTLALAAGLAGCAPLVWPHGERTQPEVDGQLVSAGVPRAGVRISACRGVPESGVELSSHRCDGVAWATTDAQGRFHFESIERSKLLLDNHTASYVILTVESPGRELTWHRAYPGEAPVRESLRCELGEKLACVSAPQP
ncbi:MAG TPA: hypothetical protein VIP05_02430 [Burkholderiaceae bacterium]